MNKNVIQNLSPQISETATERIVSGRTFIKHSDGEHGGPPPELLRERDEENEKSERESLLTKMESPLVVAQHNLDEAREFEQHVEGFVNSVWLEKNPPANSETIKFKIVNFFKGVRVNVLAEASRRDEFLLRISVIPFTESPPEKVQVEVRGQRKHIVGGVPSKSVIQQYPLAFFHLADFLESHRPEDGRDVEVLEILAEPDQGHTAEQRIEPAKQPTIQDLISGLTAALTANKPAMP
jgi:hypothetical protein